MILSFSLSAANGIAKYVTSPDDDVFISLAKTYSYKHTNMFYGNHCSDSFPEGITNGALWYPVTGKSVVEMQIKQVNKMFLGCKSILYNHMQRSAL